MGQRIQARTLALLFRSIDDIIHLPSAAVTRTVRLSPPSDFRSLIDKLNAFVTAPYSLAAQQSSYKEVDRLG